MFSARHTTKPVEGFLSLRLRGWLLAALLGLLTLSCAGQDPVPPSQPAPSQSQQNQSTQSPANENQAPQGQPAAGESSSREQSSPKGQTPQSQLPKDAVPQNKATQNPAAQPAKNAAQNQSPITLDSSETIFSVLTALNACGYDQDLNSSDATRLNVRAEVQRHLQESEEAQAALSALCEFYQKHTPDRNTNRSLAPYISLALYMDGPPHFVPRLKEEELPPDAAAIMGFGTVLEHFYEKAGAALDLGAAPQGLRGGDGTLSRTAGQHGVRHRDLLEAVFLAVPGAEVRDLSGLHGLAERDGCSELRLGLLRGGLPGSECGCGSDAGVGR